MTVPHTRTNCVFLTSTCISGKVATDQTGRFPATSVEGNNYIMILFAKDANGILAEALKKEVR